MRDTDTDRCRERHSDKDTKYDSRLSSPSKISVAVTARHFCVFKGHGRHADTGVKVETETPEEKYKQLHNHG